MKKLMITLTLLLGLQSQVTYPFDEYAESFNSGVKHGIQNFVSSLFVEPAKYWSKKFAEDTYPWLKQHKEIVAATAGVLTLAILVYSYFKNKKSEPCVIHKSNSIRQTKATPRHIL